MKTLRYVITGVCVAAPFIANAGEKLAANAKSAAIQPIAVELQSLQGTWLGVQMGDNARQQITISVTGNSLHFDRDTNFWFKTTLSLPAGKDPKQMHAKIESCPPSQASSLGQTVRTIYKIEDGTWTLLTIGDDPEETPKGFDGTGARYELRKVQPQKQNTEPPKTK